MTDDEALERIGHERLLTVTESAEAVGASPWTIRQWVNRGHLEPVPGIQPMTFFESDVLDCQTRRRGPEKAERVSSLSARFLAVQ